MLLTNSTTAAARSTDDFDWRARFRKMRVNIHRTCFALIIGAVAVHLIVHGTRTDERRLQPLQHALGSCKLRVLVAHEQHLRHGGSDQRLLALLQSLHSMGAQTSLLVRTGKCGQCVRSPSTEELAAMLGHSSQEAVLLKADGRPPLPPPRIYEFGGTQAFYALLHAAAFDLILVGLWFWYDPQPAFAEILSPIIAAHNDNLRTSKTVGKGRVLLAFLADDAHSERARRLSEEEPDPTQRLEYRTQTRNFAARQRELYASADGVFYLTQPDLDLEADIRVTANRLAIALSRARAKLWGYRMQYQSHTHLHAGLLRMMVHPELSVGSAADAIVGPTIGASLGAAHGPPSEQTPYIGFVGGGDTATNRLGLRRFVSEGWPVLRRAWPTVRCAPHSLYFAG